MRDKQNHAEIDFQSFRLAIHAFADRHHLWRSVEDRHGVGMAYIQIPDGRGAIQLEPVLAPDGRLGIRCARLRWWPAMRSRLQKVPLLDTLPFPRNATGDELFQMSAQPGQDAGDLLDQAWQRIESLR